MKERRQIMKAWKVIDRYENLFTEVVFAETSGQAKSLALQNSYCLCDYGFTELEAHRLPAIDKYYKEGKIMMDWCDQDDRYALVKNCDFHCDDDTFNIYECNDCKAKKICARYAETLEV